MITRQTMKQCSLGFLVAVTLVTVGCGANSPIAPEAVSRSIAPLADTVSATAGAAVAARALFPPIDPPGISCPSDAPQIRVGSLGTRLDVEFSEIKGTIAYEIEIRDSAGAVAALLKIDAPAHYAEWRGRGGAYLVRVRSRNCGGFGNWSESVYHSIQDSSTPTEGCNLKGDFAVLQDSFTFWPAGELKDADVTIKFDNGGGTWRIELVASNDDAASDTELERQTGGVWLTNANIRVECGGTATRSVHEGNHAWPYWWYRIYRDGVLMHTSDRHSL